MRLQAEIIAIGSELLLGCRLDTNSLFLTEQLAGLGIEVRYKTVVGDVRADLVGAIRTAARRVGLVVMTGGLGPTRDDLTREAVAEVTRRPLRRHPQALKGLQKRLRLWGRTPTRAQLQQALVPRGADVLDNPIGSAPGFALTFKKVLLAALPGVPIEAREMFATAMMPKLSALDETWRSQCRIESQVLHTFGLPESEVDRRIHQIGRALQGVHVGLLASPRGVAVSFTKIHTVKKAMRAYTVRGLDRIVVAARARLGQHVYAVGPDTMEQVVGRALTAQRRKLAVAESCTGGLIGHRLTEVPGSSTYLDRVAVTYSNEAKREWLGVSDRLIERHGAVSAEVAAAMARGVRLHSRANVGLSVTGIAGPGGATAKKPVGLVYIALDAAGIRGHASGRATRLVRQFQFHGPRDAIKLRASQAALDLLRQWLESEAR
jgi:nicotinamide-nucleotide amidase